ncbi:peptidase M23 [Subtercola sp. Z020]|uniref:M23 family metallopeptidase n=1 Tax=Subtercola sp. Z020 TaxID=2080582 RepID=UPI000CE8F8BC|nr:M23 family metallopeptidase [Subtercola sp. Z020]PPF80559.1 peptidase M23 [Subtercola sp. Z020]
MTEHSAPARPRRPLRALLQAAVVSFALVLGDALAPEAARAVDYPSWEDVLAARSNEASKQGEIARIQNLISGLEAETVAAQALSEQRGAEYETAQIAFDEGVRVSDELDQKAGEAEAEAAASSQRAGSIAAQLARSGGSNLSIALLGGSGGGDADALLYQLGALSKLTEQTSGIYAAAEQSRNSAAAIASQAEVAEAALDGLRIAAEQALAEAAAAQQAVEQMLAEEQSRRVELAAQLDVLVSNRVATEADYQAGVAERARIAAERARAEAEARAAAERERAARGGGGGGGGGGGAGGETGPIITGPGGQGWSSPLPNARVTSEFGNRFHPIDAVWRLHAGIDLVSPGGTCGANVYAASAGTVTFAGSNGGLGNAVTISHGGGRTTVYGHNTSLVVRSGWSVVEGQLIAKAGTTGASTGCHVHFETRLNGTAQNPRQVLGQYGTGF